MQRELARLRRSRELAFWLLLVFYALILAGAAVLIVVNRTDPVAIGKLFGATGVTLMAVMAAMVNLWAQKSRTDLVMAIANGMSEDGAMAALNALLPKL